MRRAGNALGAPVFEAETAQPFIDAAEAAGLDTSLDSLEGSAHQAFLDLTAAANAAGLFFTVRSTRRTCQQQFDLFQIGRLPGDTRKVVTHANGCVSWHVTGRAIDVTMTQGSYADLGALAKSLGFKWGGDFAGFPDPGHVEWHPGMTIEQICPNPLACVDSNVDTTLPGGGALPTGDAAGSSTFTTAALLVAAGLVTFAVAKRLA